MDKKTEKNRISFNYQEVVECLIKKAEIHEGIWGISIGFGFGAVNVTDPNDEESLMPAGVIPIGSIGIERLEEHQKNLSVDASLVNPSKSQANKPKKKKV